jgi:hypothetical protein
MLLILNAFSRGVTPLQEGADVGRKVRTDVGGISHGVRHGNEIRRHAGGAEHGRVRFRKVHPKTEGAQNFSRSDACAPRNLGGALLRGGIQLEIIIAHEIVQIRRSRNFLPDGFFLFGHGKASIL